MTDPIIRCHAVKKVLRNRLTPAEPTIAFRLDEWCVQEGEQVAIVGPSGCGKSTLLHLLAGLTRSDAGVIEVAQTALPTLSPVQLDQFRATHIGLIFQRHNLLAALSAIENVRVGLRFGRHWPRRQWETRARELLDRVGLGHRKHVGAEQLSMGEQQRVAIARALANRPRLLLADEPTAHLDPGSAQQIARLLLDACRSEGKTLVVVTHDAAVAGLMDRTFDAGRLIEESDHPQ